MKKIFLLILGVLFLTGCDFLDIVPDDTATLEDAFKDEDAARKFVYGCYAFQKGVNTNGRGPSDLRYEVGPMSSNELLGSYHWTAQWFQFMKLTSGTDNSSSPVYDYWSLYYQGIRHCYLFLDNIDKVVPVAMEPNVFEDSKKEWKAEVRFLIAYYHHCLLQYYGPIVVSEGISNEKFPRLPLDQCVDKIAEWYDEAAISLPENRNTSNYGRATKLIAKSMKAKLLLYAASPLFNGNSDFVELKDKEGNLLISQTYDKEKWKKAMTASKEAITYAEALGYHLYKWTGNDPLTKKPVADAFRQAYLNTRYMIVDRENWESELIWGFTENGGNEIQSLTIPRGLDNRENQQGSPNGGISPSLTTVKLFYTSRGLAPEVDPSFPWEKRMEVSDETNTCLLHMDREPRFYAAIGYDRGTYEFNGMGTKEYTLRLKCGNGEEKSSLLGGGKNPEPNGCIGPNRRGNDHLYTGYALKKMVCPDGEATASKFSTKSYSWPMMRLADLYLMYAEACAEYTGSLDVDAKRYISLIHERAGIPDQYHNASGTSLVESVRRERMIEFVFEGHWYNDLRRWKMAEEWYRNDKDGMWGLNEMGQTPEDFYKEVQCKNQPYIFQKSNYLMPIKTSYININSKLVQNPGY